MKMVTFIHLDVKCRAEDAGDEEAMFYDADYIKALDRPAPRHERARFCL